jgi:nitrite reductase/ring-hydroxylating ferredoxin subunit
VTARVQPAEDAFELVARVDELPEEGLLSVSRSNGDRICLARKDGRIYALADACTHQEFPMVEGILHSSDGRCVIECIWHGARFDCATGEALRQPAVDPLPTYAVRVHEGGIYVGGPVAGPPR